MIGKLERVALREVWKHEARDFTTWLQDNVELLNDILALNLSSAEPEQSAGVFRVDLVAEDEGRNLVVIENQLEKSDHEHLGKLITYLTAIGAKIAIWIVADPRPEHVRAVSWLNESSSADFYLVKVEAVRIGDSAPAPLLTLITGPSQETREVRATKQDLAERYVLRKRFWTDLLEVARPKTKLHANISPSKDNWISAGAGTYGLVFAYVIRQHDGRVELYIDRGKGAEEENLTILEALQRDREAIEERFGEPLEWQELEGRRACRIMRSVEVGGYRDETKWPEVHEAMTDAMARLGKALKPRIAKLRIG